MRELPATSPGSPAAVSTDPATGARLPGPSDPKRTPACPPQWWLTAASGLAVAAAVVHAERAAPRMGALLVLGTAMGITLYHAAFGFTAAYRRLVRDRDLSGFTAQLLMLGLATVLFAPVLGAGEVFGHGINGAFAPVSVSMAFGALLFGIGMQIGGGCASGTLFTVGGGSPRMVVVLVFFCLGCFWATFHFGWWTALPSAGVLSLGDLLGRWRAVGAQLLVLLALAGALFALGYRQKTSLWPPPFALTWRQLLRGPWPLVLGAALLALLNWATLLVASHPWSITWGFTLWAAKLAVLLGWDPAGTPFWSGGFTERALHAPLLTDTTTVMNLGIVLGALTAASLAGRFRIRARMTPGSLITAAVGGLLLGYGARLAYGCNIGAMFSGIASTSLHGWVWLVMGLAGNVAGLKLRRTLRLDSG